MTTGETEYNAADVAHRHYLHKFSENHRGQLDMQPVNLQPH